MSDVGLFPVLPYSGQMMAMVGLIIVPCFSVSIIESEKFPGFSISVEKEKRLLLTIWDNFSQIRIFDCCVSSVLNNCGPD